jgi:guanine deaminase
MFLGSGLFRLGQCTDPDAKVRLAMGTDMGGGNNFSMFKVLDDGYKVGMLNNCVLMVNYDPRQRDVAQAERNKLSAYRGLYLITLGGAKALYIDEYTGNFSPGKEADFVVIAPDSGPPQMAWHQSLYGGPGAPENIDDCADKFFGLMSVGDDRNVEKTYIAGKLAYEKNH